MTAPILLLAETGFILRNLVLGKFADEVTRERPLIVATPRPEDERLQAIVRGKRIELVRYPIQPPLIPQRRLDVLRSRDMWMYRLRQGAKSSESVRLQTRLFENRMQTLGARFWKGTLVEAGRLIHRVGAMGMLEDWYLDKIDASPITDAWRKILDDVNPAAVVSTMLTHSTLYASSNDLPAVIAARSRQIRIGTLVQSWDNLSSKTSILPPWLDRYWSWSGAMTEELLRYNPRVTRRSVVEVGSPQFDYHLEPGLVEDRATYMKSVGLDPSRKTVVIGTGTRKWLPQEPATVLDLVRRLGVLEVPTQALIRLHPKDDGKRWEPYRAELTRLGASLQVTAPPVHMDEGGFVPPRDFYRDQVNCLRHADVVLNTASTLTVDAAIIDRPVICFGYNMEADPLFPEGRASAFSKSTHYAPLVATGGVLVASSAEECIAQIGRYLRDPLLDRASRSAIVALVTNTVDGRAGIRLAAEVLSLAGERPASAHTPQVGFTRT